MKYITMAWLGIFFTITAIGLAQQRPRDPWVFRCVLDDTPRALVIALDKDLWLAYNTENSRLVKMWSGGIHFRGEVYTSEKVVQPTTYGHYYHLPELDTAVVFWAKKKQQLVPLTSAFKAYKVWNNQVALIYELALDGQVLQVTEYPEIVVQKDKNQITFERKFYVSAPENVEWYMHLHALHMKKNKSWMSNKKPVILERKQVFTTPDQPLYYEKLQFKCVGNDSLIFTQKMIKPY